MTNKTKQDIDFEIQFYEGVLSNSPNFEQALIVLGDLYTKRELYEKGLEIDLRLSTLRPDDAVVFYNLACSWCLLNDLSQSLAALRRAIELGYDDFTHLEADSHLLTLFKDEDFREYIQKLKTKKKQTNCAGKPL